MNPKEGACLRATAQNRSNENLGMNREGVEEVMIYTVEVASVASFGSNKVIGLISCAACLVHDALDWTFAVS